MIPSCRRRDVTAAASLARVRLFEGEGSLVRRSSRVIAKATTPSCRSLFGSSSLSSLGVSIDEDECEESRCCDPTRHKAEGGEDSGVSRKDRDCGDCARTDRDHRELPIDARRASWTVSRRSPRPERRRLAARPWVRRADLRTTARCREGAGCAVGTCGSSSARQP